MQARHSAIESKISIKLYIFSCIMITYLFDWCQKVSFYFVSFHIVEEDAVIPLLMWE
jgi:hypothetical protein